MNLPGESREVPCTLLGNRTFFIRWYQSSMLEVFYTSTLFSNFIWAWKLDLPGIFFQKRPLCPRSPNSPQPHSMLYSGQEIPWGSYRWNVCYLPLRASCHNSGYSFQVDPSAIQRWCGTGRIVIFFGLSMDSKICYAYCMCPNCITLRLTCINSMYHLALC